VLTPGASDPLAQRDGAGGPGDVLQGHVAQIDGRTMFFTPDAPPPPPREIVDAGPAEPEPDPPPSRYGGPSIVGMMFDSVWFSNDTTLEIGESGGGITLLGMDAPWSARVEWRGVEFDVPFMQRDEVVFEDTGSGSAVRRAEATSVSGGSDGDDDQTEDPRERSGDRSQ
jgi:hypothetical protein